MKKQNKRNQFTRMALALLLILSMLGNTLIFPTVAQETVAPVDDTTSSETPSADEATTDAISTPTLPEPILLTAADIPEFISAAALTERGAVERMRSEETNMSSVIFRNSDGTRTMYMYGLPVKYTSADGTVRDKSTNLVSVSTASVLLSDQPVAQTMAQMSLAQQEALQAELGILDVERAADTLHMLSTALTARQRSLSDMAYTTLDNDVYALFPTNLAKGMTLVFGEHSVRMTPAGTGMTVTAGGNVTKTTTSSLSDADVTERLLYPNVFGLGTAVQYTPTLTGVKEEILLSRNVGKNNFAFLLETGGLVLTEQSSQFVLIDPETEQQVGKLGEIIVFDSAGQVVRGNMTAQTILAGQKYVITISVDQEFLASATYPVSIDPSMDLYTVRIDNIGDSDVMIEDVSLYNNPAAEGYTFIEWHQIGKVISTDYRGQAAFRFPFLYDPLVDFSYYSLTSNDISSFVLHLNSPMNTTATNVLRVNQYVPEWPNTTKVFDSSYFDYYNSTDNDLIINNVPSNSTFSVDLTGLVKKWKDIQHGVDTDDYYLGSAETGVLLYNLNNEGDIWLEAAGYSEDIHVTMDYALPGTVTGTVYINSFCTRTFLAREDDNELIMKAGTISEIGTQIAWEIVYRGQDRYTLHPAGNRNLYLYEDATLVDYLDDYCYWLIEDSSIGVFFENYGTGEVIVPEIDNTLVTVPKTALSDLEKAWRVVNTASYNAQELTSISAPPQTIIDKGQTDVVNRYDFSVSPANAFWSSAQDFEISIQSGAAYIGYNETTGVVTANEYGIAQIRILHIPTAVEITFEVFVPKYEVSVTHYYDQGFINRYGGEEAALQAIQKCNSRVEAVFASLFLLTIDDSYDEYTSLADEFMNEHPGTTVDKFMDCVTRDQLNEDAASKIGSGTDVMIKIIWTGHRLEGDVVSASYDNTNIIIMTPREAFPRGALPLSDLGKINEYSPILLHEISHQLGAADHYCYDGRTPSGDCANPKNDCYFCDHGWTNEPYCFMSNYYNNGLFTLFNNGTWSTLYCSQCMSSTHRYGILAHLEDHNDRD